jgi:Zn-dependent protease with chaperone function
MAKVVENRYAHWLKVDNDLCLPVIDKGGLDTILGQVAVRVHQVMGLGPKPSICLDLEHLQVADYAAFAGVGEKQREFITRLHTQEPVRPEEMIFLALRSLYQFTWPKPKSDDDVRFAAAYDYELHQILMDVALGLAKGFTAPEARLPYWARLAFLRVMVALPIDNVARFGLDRVACTLIKSATFNATIFALENGPLIGMNYALEPILKHFNRYLLHYFSTQEMAGPTRLSRAWEGIVPTVLHFWSDVVATALTRSSAPLFDETMAFMAHQLTADQICFIVMHELGHVALDHPHRIHAEGNLGVDVTTVRHEFEFAADAFALGLMRSRLVRRVRNITMPGEVGSESRPVDDLTASLHEYQQELGAAYLLFVYMDFIQRAGELLRDRLGGHIKIREQMDTHPRAGNRLERLELVNAGEYLYTSPIQRYARDFLQTVLDYAAALDDGALLASVRSASDSRRY